MIPIDMFLKIGREINFNNLSSWNCGIEETQKWQWRSCDKKQQTGAAAKRKDNFTI